MRIPRNNALFPHPATALVVDGLGVRGGGPGGGGPACGVAGDGRCGSVPVQLPMRGLRAVLGGRACR
jgi:hypothetical protein